MEKYIHALNHRYSVKKFDKNKKIDKNTIERIIEAGRLSVSSLGLQPYRIIVIENDEKLQSLIPAFHNPSQVSTCSHLIAIVSRKRIDNEYIDAYFNHISTTRNLEVELLAPFKKIVEEYKGQHSEDELLHWNEKQSYILLGNMVFAAALEGIDSCPMEGFFREELGNLLQIDTQKEQVTVTVALGTRAEDDFFQTLKKVRKPNDKFLEFI